MQQKAKDNLVNGVVAKVGTHAPRALSKRSSRHARAQARTETVAAITQSKAVDYEVYELVRRRASYQVYLRYGLNRYELWALCQLEAYLLSVGHWAISQNRFIDTICNNVKDKRKTFGYIQGLVARRLVGTYEFIAVPGSLCLSVSDYGLRVLNEYHSQISILIERFRPGVPKNLDRSKYRQIETIAA